MAQAATPAPAPAKEKRTRSPSPPRTAFIIAQAIDANGNPMAGFGKANLKVLSVETNAETVLEKVESGDTQGAFYVRVTVPNRAQSAKPAQAPRPVPAAA